MKKISVGLGVEPTYFFVKNRYLYEYKTNVDVPIVAKIVYNLKFVEIGIIGKYGLVNLFETEHLKSGKIREVQLSVFIPFYSSHGKK